MVAGDLASDRVIDRLPGQMDVYSAVTGTGTNRVFFLAARSGRARSADRDPETSQIPPGAAFRVRIDDSGRVAELTAVLSFPGQGVGVQIYLSCRVSAFRPTCRVA